MIIRLYSWREFRSTVLRNLWAFYLAICGRVDLDPEQEGFVWEWTRNDWVYMLFGQVFIFMFLFLLSVPASLLYIVSPHVACGFLEIGGFQREGDQKHRAPRVWLSRWYLIPFVIGMILIPLPAIIRWIIIVYYVMMTFVQSGFYRTDFDYWVEQRKQNPNPDHFRIHNLGFMYLNKCWEHLAEQEYEDVLYRDPDNFQAQSMLSLFRVNRSIHAQGVIGLSFKCAFCHYEPGLRTIRDGDRLTESEHQMYWFRRCPKCNRISKAVPMS